MIGQFVGVVGARREVSGQNLSAQIDSRRETLDWTIGPQFAGQDGDRLGPGILIHLGVDAFVGDQLDLMLVQSSKQQDAGAFGGDMDALGQELLQGGFSDATTTDPGRRDQPTNGGNARQQEDADEDQGLRQGIEGQGLTRGGGLGGIMRGFPAVAGPAEIQ